MLSGDWISTASPSSGKLRPIGALRAARIGPVPFSRAVRRQLRKPVGQLGVRPEPDEQLIDTVLAVAVALRALDTQQIELADQVARGHGAVVGHGVPQSAFWPFLSSAAPARQIRGAGFVQVFGVRRETGKE